MQLSSSCADQESFVRGVQLNSDVFFFLFCFVFYEGIQILWLADNGPLFNAGLIAL